MFNIKCPNCQSKVSIISRWLLAKKELTCSNCQSNILIDPKQYQKYSAISGGLVGGLGSIVGMFLLDELTFAWKLLGILITGIIVTTSAMLLLSKKARISLK